MISDRGRLFDVGFLVNIGNRLLSYGPVIISKPGQIDFTAETLRFIDTFHQRNYEKVYPVAILFMIMYEMAAVFVLKKKKGTIKASKRH